MDDSGDSSSHPYGTTKNKQPRRPPSVVWYYFDKIPEEPQRARCKLCGNVCHHANNTSNLFKHLQKKHPAQHSEAESQREAEMELYQEIKAKFVKPLVRTGVRGRRPKALTQRLLSQQGLVSEKRDVKPSIHGMPTASVSTSSPRTFTTPEKPRRTLNKALLRFLAMDLQPTSLVDGPGFRELVRTLDSRYDLPSREQIDKGLLAEFADETRNKVKLEVVLASYVCLSISLWQHCGTAAQCCITAHFIKDNWESATVTLESFDRTQETTGEGLAARIKATTDFWGITERLTTLMSAGTDPTITQAALNLGLDHLACFGHALNTVVLAALHAVPEIARIIKKTSAAVEYFSLCGRAADTLASVQQQHSIPQNRLKQEVPGRWMSTLAMMQRMVEQFEAVNTVLCFLSKDHMCLCDDEVELLREVITVLKPFQAATEDLLSMPYPPLSKVIPLSALLQQVTQASLEPTVPTARTQLKTALVQEMQLHFSGFESTPQLALATLLDPRFKRHAFTDMEALQAAQTRLAGELTAAVQSTSAESVKVLTDDSVVGDDNSPGSFWNMFDRKVSEAGALKNTATEADNESRRYFQETNIPRVSDPVAWWRVHQAAYPHLKLLAQRYLALPATAAHTKWLFTKKGDKEQKARDTLPAHDLNNILFLHHNI